MHRTSKTATCRKATTKSRGARSNANPRQEGHASRPCDTHATQRGPAQRDTEFGGESERETGARGNDTVQRRKKTGNGPFDKESRDTAGRWSQRGAQLDGIKTHRAPELRRRTPRTEDGDETVRTATTEAEQRARRVNSKTRKRSKMGVNR